MSYQHIYIGDYLDIMIPYFYVYLYDQVLRFSNKLPEMTCYVDVRTKTAGHRQP